MTWQLEANSNFVTGESIGVGTYDVTAWSRLPTLAVAIDDVSCNGEASGTLTIVEYAASPGDQATVSRLLLWFDLVCAGEGELTGFVASNILERVPLRKHPAGQ